MEITASLVKELREVTGAGMMDCKKALQEAEGNMERAVDILREKGELSLNQCCKLCRFSRYTACKLLADFIRFDLITPVFHSHKFYFTLKEE